MVHPANPFVWFRKEEVEQSIPARFQQQVHLRFSQTAVRTRTCQFSYGDLNLVANHVARAILERTGEGEQRVALLMEHDAPMIAALFGVLKAGKVAVPLDPLYPALRAAYIVEDSQSSIVITDNRNLPLARRLPQNLVRTINFDEIHLGRAATEPGLHISPHAAADIIYTSGSTGHPKGVVRSHRGTLHNAMAHTNGLHLCADDRIPLLASCSSGQGISTVFCALLNGAALYPLDIKEEGMAGLASWLNEKNITVYISAATVYRYFLRTLTGKEEFPRLRLVRLGSEQVRNQDVELYRKHFSRDCIFVNAISSTET